jgi:hypothetical protein
MDDGTCESARSPGRWLQLRLSTLLLLVAIAALAAGWFADRRRLEHEIQSLRRETHVIQLKFVSSDHAAGTLKEMLGAASHVALASDARSNCIVVTGSTRDIDSVKEVLANLDQTTITAPAGATTR